MAGPCRLEQGWHWSMQTACLQKTVHLAQIRRLGMQSTNVPQQHSLHGSTHAAHMDLTPQHAKGCHLQMCAQK